MCSSVADRLQAHEECFLLKRTSLNLQGLDMIDHEQSRACQFGGRVHAYSMNSDLEVLKRCKRKVVLITYSIYSDLEFLQRCKRKVVLITLGE